jgi:hypothetical protein
MTTSTTDSPRGQPAAAPPAGSQAHFLAAVWPAVERHARVYFRHLRCPHAREEAVAEAVALAWAWHLRLARRGRDAGLFPRALAAFAARAVASGRRLCGQERAGDVLSPRARRRRGFAVCTLPAAGPPSANPFAEALADNTRSPVPDQAAFRLDFPAWLGTLGARGRGIAEGMALGRGTWELARAYGISESRVSQLRREFHGDWQRFTGDRPADAA